MLISRPWPAMELMSLGEFMPLAIREGIVEAEIFMPSARHFCTTFVQPFFWRDSNAYSSIRA